jgi:hypothetical protein
MNFTFDELELFYSYFDPKTTYKELSPEDKNLWSQAKKNYEELPTHEKIAFHKDWDRAVKSTKQAMKVGDNSGHMAAWIAHNTATKSAPTRKLKQFHTKIARAHKSKAGTSNDIVMTGGKPSVVMSPEAFEKAFKKKFKA